MYEEQGADYQKLPPAEPEKQPRLMTPGCQVARVIQESVLPRKIVLRTDRCGQLGSQHRQGWNKEVVRPRCATLAWS